MSKEIQMGPWETHDEIIIVTTVITTVKDMGLAERRDLANDLQECIGAHLDKNYSRVVNHFVVGASTDYAQ